MLDIAPANTMPARAPAPWGRIGAMLACALLLFVALAHLMDAGARVESPRVQRFDQALLLAADGSESGPRAIRVRGNCHARGECERRFRIKFMNDAIADPAAPGALHALYIPQYTGRLQVTLNGVPVADSTRGQTSLRLGQGAPQLAVLPRRVLQPGFNEIGIALGARMGAAAVGPIYFGPDTELRGHYEVAQFLVITLPRLMDGALFAIGAIMLMIWFTRRHDHLYLLCAAISLSFALSSLSPVIASAFGMGLLMPVNVLRYLGACLLLPFAWHLVGRVPRARTRWFLLPPLAMFLAFRYLPSAWSTLLVPLLFVPVALVLAGIALHELWRAGTRGGDGSALVLLSAIGVTLALGTRDQLVMTDLLDNGYVLLARFNGPLLATIMGATLLQRFAAGLSLLEDFNARLHRDVATARGKLQAAFEREQAQERKATLAAERMRLMGDLHDGIAGQLVSIIALGERTAGGVAAEITRACHRALTDLRLVVDSMEDVGEDLGMTLAAFRERLEPQLRRSGIRLDWRVRDLPDLPGLAPATTLAIFRVLQEAANNAARHSGSAIVEVASAPSPLPGYGVRLSVRDHGRGGAAVRRGHYGMENMRRRAAALGAVLAVDSDASGTCVVLDLPPRLKG